MKRYLPVDKEEWGEVKTLMGCIGGGSGVIGAFMLGAGGSVAGMAAMTVGFPLLLASPVLLSYLHIDRERRDEIEESWKD